MTPAALLRAVACCLGTFAALAGVLALTVDPAAVNAAIGLGFWSVLFGVLAVVEYVARRRAHRRHEQIQRERGVR